MNWVVAVPSYKRPEQLQKKTLMTLHNGKVPASKIFVFVVPEDEAAYKAALNPEYYNSIIVGDLGLIQQRKFIMKHFPKNQWILFMDDDVMKLMSRISDKAVAVIEDLNPMITKGFETMKREGANIWGIYPTANPFYMKEGYTTNLRYIVGAFYGLKNTKCKAYALKYTDGQEDKERTLRHWVKDGVVVRFNDIAPKTSYYAAGGILAREPDRIKKTKEATGLLLAEFPKYIRQVYKKANDSYDLLFRTGKIAQRTAPILDTGIQTLTIRDMPAYETARTALLEQLRKTIIPKIKGGMPNAGPGRGDVIGQIGRTMVFGYGMRTFKGYGEFISNGRYPDLFKFLVAFGNLVVPKDWTYQAITLNHGVEAKKHKDSKNCGDSVIIGIGDYTGGNLRIWETDDCEGEDYDLHNMPRIFNGALHYHQTMPFEGERYTMIFYKQRNEGGTTGVTMVGV